MKGKKMKKISALLLVATAAIIISGCASSGTHGEVAEKYEKFKEATANRPPAFVLTGDRSVDDVGKLSAQVYGSTIKYLDEYVKATENNRYYIGFMNDVAETAKEKKIPVPEAMAQVLKEYQDGDAKAKPEEKVYPRVVEGYKAVEALKPANKLRELAPLALQAGKVALQAKNLSKTVQKTYSSISFSDVEGLRKKALVTTAAAKIVEQAIFDTIALDFLQDQYKRNEEMKKYMQK